jgi:MinD superfamily P-loop ATPase containing an inserted ferredoxin domain
MHIIFHNPLGELIMKTALFFTTGTGNSLWAARTVADELGNAELIPMLWAAGNPVQSQADAVGIIFPVHIWGLPQQVITFVNALAIDTSKYYFALAVNAGQVAATLLQLKKIMKSRGLFLSSGFDIVMPSNYIPWGGPGPEDKRMRRISDAKEKIHKISSIVAKKERCPVEKGPLWQNFLFSWFYKFSFPYIPKMDKDFWVDDKCNSCTICKKICPCGNIDLKAGKPVWLHHCEQCLACIQWCPKEAIQYGKKTPRYERYHHPEVTLEDIISISQRASRSGDAQNNTYSLIGQGRST